MSKFIIVCIFSFLGFTSNEAPNNNEGEKYKFDSVLSDGICADFNSLNTRIRDGLISKQEALKQIQTLIPLIKKYFYKKGGHDSVKSNWVFPIQGYALKSIGGTNGSGYIESGYDYFDGNKHRGHPAHDIFIVDKNQDCIDDITKKSVNVLSMTGGIVIAIAPSWDTISNLRGGKYIMIYEPCSNSIFYYAHNDRIYVSLCDIVNPGDRIATVGRTGLNAFKKRSPTHLHLMELKLNDNYYPKPYNYYNDLIKINTPTK